MFQSPDNRKHISLMLSEVLDDIGVNDRMLMKARKHYKLSETMQTIITKSVGYTMTSYFLGSRTEGTTTLGLKSDIDELVTLNNFNVIQNWSEWEQGKNNYLIIQDENTTPGYCFLQLLNHVIPLPAIVIPNKSHINDSKGRILCKNKVIEVDHFEQATYHGPSIATQRRPGFIDTDQVIAYPCKSWPKSAASDWLKRQCRWPTQDMRKKAVSTGCCVVPTGSKVSEYPELEWRISTSLAERCLMLDLDITQIKCYVLLKMILKSLLNPQGEINISSFMCKTILLHCIEQKEPSLWKENNLLECLKECLMKLNSCVQNDNLPHFIIPENNLMAGQFTAETKLQLLKNISDFIQNDVQSIFRIDIDNLAQRLQVKLNLVPNGDYNLESSLDICESVSASNYLAFIIACSNYGNNHSFHFHKLHKDIERLKQTVEKLMTFNNNENKLEHDAFTFLAPFLCSIYGSALASESIGLKNQVSPQALVWLLDGFESDVSSGRLKLASVFYSAGNMDKTEIILRYTESQFYSYPVVSICSCWFQMPPPEVPAEVRKICNEQNEDCVKNVTALCVNFSKQEISCVPHELKYEMFRSTQDDIKHRDQFRYFWMDLAVVDSLPFLYFLQYKVYRYLHRYQDQQQALSKLANTIETDKNLGHKETALNILGQCLEQEKRPKQALKCYLLSLRQRERNNVARIHICRLLFGVLVDMECILYSRT